MALATGKNRAKPAKPRPDFPLFAHQTGRWAKKVRGRLFYFGPWGDPQRALGKSLDQKDELLAGRRPRENGCAATVRDLANAFLRAKRSLADASEMTPRRRSQAMPAIFLAQQ